MVFPYRIRLYALSLCLSLIGLNASPQVLHSEADSLPRIRKMALSDVVFSQVQDSVAQGYKAENGSGRYPDLFISTWRAGPRDDLFYLAARLSLPYEALATLNGYGDSKPALDGTTVLVPSIHGIFIAEPPRNDIDRMVRARLASEGKNGLRIVIDAGNGPRGFLFFRGERFYQTERAFFLNAGFRPPLREATLTSAYGMRNSPIDGHDRFHKGIDLAAPLGSEVLAARSGTVSQKLNDPVLGLTVVLSHDGGWETVYGHLSSIQVELNQRVLSGTILGAVGSTGMSTGPHLHFEIRMGGSSRDPANLLPGTWP